MNILKALNALSPPAATTDANEGDKKSDPSPPRTKEESERTNLMAQALIRHESISNRVHSRRK